MVLAHEKLGFKRRPLAPLISPSLSRAFVSIIVDLRIQYCSAMHNACANARYTCKFAGGYFIA
ncbi:hypothetical protein MPC1_790007 [Methylocella tundrae]|nr:hypothetical protein MPC1_790007 [Methylocella tundrae]